MRDEAARAQLDGDIADMLADPFVKRLGLGARIVDAGGDGVRLFLDRRRRRDLVQRQRRIGVGEIIIGRQARNPEMRTLVQTRHRRGGTGLRRGIGEFPAIDHPVAAGCHALAHVLGIDVRRQAFWDVERDLSVVGFQPQIGIIRHRELTGNDGLLVVALFGIDHGVPGFDIWEDDHLLLDIGVNRRQALGRGMLVHDRAGIDGDFPAIGFLGIGVGNLHLFQGGVVAHWKLAHRHTRRHFQHLDGVGDGAFGAAFAIDHDVVAELPDAQRRPRCFGRLRLCGQGGGETQQQRPAILSCRRHVFSPGRLNHSVYYLSCRTRRRRGAKAPCPGRNDPVADVIRSSLGFRNALHKLICLRN